MLRALLRFWKMLGVASIESISMIFYFIFFFLKKELILLFLLSVDGACSISSSRRIKYSKSFENPGDGGRSFAVVVDVLSLDS